MVEYLTLFVVNIVYLYNKFTFFICFPFLTDLKRGNKSVIFDLFGGIEQTKLVCPECKHVSVRFHESYFLAVSIPTSITLNLYVVSLNAGTSVLQVQVVVPFNCNVKDLCARVGQLLVLSPQFQSASSLLRMGASTPLMLQNRPVNREFEVCWYKTNHYCIIDDQVTHHFVYRIERKNDIVIVKRRG